MAFLLTQTTKEKIIKCFFGWDKEFPKIVVTTPISFIFHNIVKIRKKRDNFFFSYMKENVGYIKIPEGRPAIAVYKTLKWIGCPIIHLGFCCGINKRLRIGDVIIFTKSIFSGKKLESKLFSKNLIKEKIGKKVFVGTNYTVPHILYVFENTKKFYFADAVDMETGLLYKTTTNAISINVVSDTIFRHFYELNKREKEKIKKGIRKMIRLTKLIIEELKQR